MELSCSTHHPTPHLLAGLTWRKMAESFWYILTSCMLATVSMQPMAKPASAMTEASTVTSRQKGMTANTSEMARVAVKRAHKDWARLEQGRGGVSGGTQSLQWGTCVLVLHWLGGLEKPWHFPICW